MHKMVLPSKVRTLPYQIHKNWISAAGMGSGTIRVTLADDGSQEPQENYIFVIE